MAAGYTSAIAKVLAQQTGYTRPQTMGYYAGAQGLNNIAQVIPQMNLKNPWVTALATGLTSALGAGLSGYGMMKDNQLDAADNKEYLGSLAGLGMTVPEGIAAGMTSEKPGVRERSEQLLPIMLQRDAELREKASDRKWEMDKMGREYELKGVQDINKANAELPGKVFGMEDTIKDNLKTDKRVSNYDNATAFFPAVMSAYKRNDAGSGVDMLYGTAKMMDGGAAVMTGDVDTLGNLGGYTAQFTNFANKIDKDGKLDEVSMNALRDIAKNRHDVARTQGEEALAAYRKSAADNNLDWNRIRSVKDWGTGETIELGLNTLKGRETYIQQKATEHGVDPLVAAAMGKTESSSELDPNAVSPKGAGGVMQLMPDRAKELGVTDVFNPRQNIDGGVKNLSNLVKRYNGDYQKALAGYNAGEGAVDKYGGLPPYRETINYVDKIIRKVGPERFPRRPDQAIYEVNGKLRLVTRQELATIERLGPNPTARAIAVALNKGGVGVG